jgi:hypothetical protein
LNVGTHGCDRPARSGRASTLGLLLLAYLSLAVAYQRAIPLFEAPDEQSHLHYVGFVSREQRLPSYSAEEDVPGEGMQPPLYYVWMAPLFAALVRADPALLDELRQASRWMYDPAVRRTKLTEARIRPQWSSQDLRRFEVDPELVALRRMRWGTLPFGLLAVAFTWAGALRVSRSPAFALLCTSLVAFDPQFLFISGYVSNDAAGAALGAAAFWLFAAAADRRAVTRRDYGVAAVLLALGFATRYSTVPVLAVTFAALFVLDARPLRPKLADAGLAAALLALLATPQLAANLARFGEPLGLSALWASAAGLMTPANYGGLGHYLTDYYFYWVFQSYWARFGWMNVVAPTPVYLAYFALTWTGLLGFCLASARRRGAEPPGSPRPDRRVVLLRRTVAAAFLATLAVHLWLNTRTVAAQGRHLFAAAPHLACLLAYGIGHLTSGRPLRVGWPTACIVCGGLVAMAIYCLTGVIAPAYS